MGASGLHRWLTQIVADGRLRSERETLEQSLPQRLSERRVETRWPANREEQWRRSSLGKLLNLSRSGCAVLVPERCHFARGERHRLVLYVGPDEVEVDGRVCWTHSSWVDSDRFTPSGFHQTAGIEFLEISSAETEQIMRYVGNLVRNHGINVEIRKSQSLRS